MELQNIIGLSNPQIVFQREVPSAVHTFMVPHLPVRRGSHHHFSMHVQKSNQQ
jgi:hypothetical protein